jgi:hypothetical protein
MSTNEHRKAGDLSADTKLGDRPAGDVRRVNEEGSLTDSNDVIRRALRGDETKGDPDERDFAGAPDKKDTAQGREETKNDSAEAANRNG